MSTLRYKAIDPERLERIERGDNYVGIRDAGLSGIEV